MNRRTFITGLGAVLAAPLAAEAQQTTGARRSIGFLFQGELTDPIVVSIKESFGRGLRDEGYVDGQNVKIEYRHADLDGLRGAASDLVRLKIDAIYAGGTPAALAAKHATETIPIVVGAMADPVADGLVASLARPGANITGNTFLAPELGPKRLQLLREVVPSVRRLAVLQHPGVYSEQTMRGMQKDMEDSAKATGIGFQVFSAKHPNDFDAAFASIVKAHAGALLVFPSPMFYVNHRRIVDLAAIHRLPTMYVFREAVTAGGLMSYGANIPDLARRAGNYVGKLLNGLKPADLPIEAPTTFDFIINLKTAKVLGLTIPRSLLLRADQVVE
jgi:putative ABC transport system substrate-binding protein